MKEHKTMQFLKIGSILGSLLMIFFLPGCSGVNSRFGCNARAETGCKDMQQVNSLASSGFFDHENRMIHRERNTNYIKPTNSLAGDLRTKEIIKKVWIASYQDLSKNLHEPSSIYMVMNRPHWVQTSEKAITRSQLNEGN